MREPLRVTVCRRCGLGAFPPHLVCRRCGSLEWDDVPEPGGTLAHATVVRRRLAAREDAEPPRVGLVVSDRGLKIVARIDASVRPGDRVLLSADAGAVLASPASEHEKERA